MVTESSPPFQTESSTTEGSERTKGIVLKNIGTTCSTDSGFSPAQSRTVSFPSFGNFHTYRVTVETADVRWAGTDAQVYIRLIGDITTSPEQHLAGGCFDRNSIDHFTFDIPHIGNLVKVIVRHDGKGWGSAWMLEKIIVKDENIQRTWVCNCSRWLNRDMANTVELVPGSSTPLSLSNFIQRRLSGMFSNNSPAKNLFGSVTSQSNVKLVAEDASPKDSMQHQRFDAFSTEKNPISPLLSSNDYIQERQETDSVNSPVPHSPPEWQYNGSPIVIRFHVNYFTQESQYLYVCGSATFLGEWNPQRALKMNMFTAPDGAWRGDWRLEVQVSRIEDFEYKYLVVDETTASITWENGEHRKMEFHRHSNQMMKIRDVWHTPSHSRKIVTSLTPCDMKSSPIISNGSATPCFRYRDKHVYFPAAETPPTTDTMIDENRSKEELVQRIAHLQQQLETKEAKLSHANALLLQKGISAVINRKDENSTWTKLTDFERENQQLKEESENMKEQLKKYEGETASLQEKVRSLKAQVKEKETATSELKQQIELMQSAPSAENNVSGGLVLYQNDFQGVTRNSLLSMQEKVQFMSAALEQVRSEVFSSIAENSEIVKHDCQTLQRIITDGQQKVLELKQRWKKEFEWRRKLFNQVQELKGNIRVFCRPRPARSASAIQVLEDNRLLTKGKVYQFDCIFHPDATQEQVYEETSPLITSVMDGYNVCLFAYGQTGSGKTYTMNGQENNRGVNYRAIEELLRIREERSEEIIYEIEMSILEIYNEQLHDLIGGSDESSQSIHSSSSKGSNQLTNHKLEIKLGPQGPYIPELCWVPVISVEQVWQVMEQASNYRIQGRTNMNDHSSRSHLIVSLRVHGQNLVTETRLSGKLHLVDLAGSERISRSEATGDRLKEAQHINKSLSCLGDVFMNLLSKSSHIPYRNSKLTFLLQDSLGGDSKTLMFVNISPEEADVQESLSSLNFASRVNRIELGQATRHVDSQELCKFAKAVNKANDELTAKEEEVQLLKQKLRETTENLQNKGKQLEQWKEQVSQEQVRMKKMAQDYEQKEKELDETKAFVQKLEKQLAESKKREPSNVSKNLPDENSLILPNGNRTPTTLYKRTSPYRRSSHHKTTESQIPNENISSSSPRTMNRTMKHETEVPERPPLIEKTENLSGAENNNFRKFDNATKTQKDELVGLSNTPKATRKVKHRVHFEEPPKSSSSSTSSCTAGAGNARSAQRKVVFAFGSRMEVSVDSRKSTLNIPKATNSLKRPAGRVLNHTKTFAIEK